MLQKLKLLIVPYGIETIVVHSHLARLWVLLIVPYGIETWISETISGTKDLLIVPYGIETKIRVTIL